jgi:hypothetical protein
MLSILVGVAGICCFWRVHLLLKRVPAFEERTAALARSVTLLTDTTEACFKTLSAQLQLAQSPNPANRAPWSVTNRRSGARGTRQRRVVSAVLRGETVAAVAAREQVAEGEVALRLHLESEPRAPRHSQEIPPIA